MRTCATAMITVAVIVSSTVPATGVTVSVTGFVKNFFVVQKPPSIYVENASPRRVEVTAPSMVANNVRARLNVAADVAGWLAVDASYNLVPRFQDDDAAAMGALQARQAVSAYRIDDVRSTLWPATPEADDNVVVLQNLDRLFVTVRAPWFDVFVGRQAVAWGSAKSVNPTDVIAPFLYTEIDTEDRVGVDAARVRVPVGALGEFDAGYVAGADGKWETSAAYLRAKSYLSGLDLAMMAMSFRENLLFGADMTFAVGGAGAWIEAAGVAMNSVGDEYLLSSGDDYARLTAGLDYSLRNATYLFIEYHYNGAGAGDVASYPLRARSSAYREGGVYLLGQHYIIPGVSYPVSLLLNVGGTVLFNAGDGSCLLAPTVEYNVLDNVYLAAGAFVGLGDQAHVFETTTPYAGDPLFDPSALQFESEFGAYPDTYFISARYYF